MTNLIDTTYEHRFNEYGYAAAEYVAEMAETDIEEIESNESEWGNEIASMVEDIAEDEEQRLMETLGDWGNEIDGFLVEYSLGLWTGRWYGVEIIDSWMELIQRCLKDNCNFEINHEKGCIEIINKHHDGTNYFYVHPITIEGVSYYNDWDYGYYDETDEEMTENEVIEHVLKTETQNNVLRVNDQALSFYYSKLRY